MSPKQVFLLDGAGALLTASLTGVVLTNFEPYFGMPANICYVLGAVAILFSFYSFNCAIILKMNHAPFLKFMAISNGIYVLITIGFLIHHFSRLTKLGVSYFVVEALVVVWAITMEWRVATQVATK